MPTNTPGGTSGERSSSLPSERAFVVQLTADAELELGGRGALEQGRCAGRVEHIRSGRCAHFECLQELTTFIAEVLRSQDPSAQKKETV